MDHTCIEYIKRMYYNNGPKFTMINFGLFDDLYRPRFYTPVYISLLTVCTGTVDDDDVVLLSE